MNRANLAAAFGAADRRSPWKTFVLEAHAGEEHVALLAQAFESARISATEDLYLHEVHDRDSDVTFVVDHLDDRYWSLHTTAPSSAAKPILKDVVEKRRDLDWMWLPSAHLRDLWPGARPEWLATDFTGRRLTRASDDVADLRLRVRGSAAEAVIALVESQYSTAVSFSGVAVNATDPELGSVNTAVTRYGRFIANGEDFGFHQAIVRRVIDHYRRFVDAVEGRALAWSPLESGGAQFNGAPIVFNFSRSIPDLERFVDQLFSAREPFRLWGIPDRLERDMVEVEAVDLHVGQRLRFDISPDWLRVYLFAGGCGNSVARLASNLQHHFDGALSLEDPHLDMHLKRSSTGEPADRDRTAPSAEQ